MKQALIVLLLILTGCTTTVKVNVDSLVPDQIEKYQINISDDHWIYIYFENIITKNKDGISYQTPFPMDTLTNVVIQDRIVSKITILNPDKVQFVVWFYRNKDVKIWKVNDEYWFKDVSVPVSMCNTNAYFQIRNIKDEIVFETKHIRFHITGQKCLSPPKALRRKS